MRCALIGMGVIGRGWAAQLLAAGHEVVCLDPDPAAPQALADYLEQARPALERSGGSLVGWRERARFTGDLAAATDGVDWIQENGPERADVRRELLARLDAAAAPDVVVASSSSGMLPSQAAADCRHHPERVLVGHPFNPVYLIPLVEVVPTPATPEAVLDRAMGFYRDLGKRPVRLRREVPGYLANRLQAALWREAYSLVEQGVASVADVDAVVAHGPGLRWALLGPLMNQHLSGGAGGLAHVLEHLGPPTQRWMDDLGNPRLTAELAALLVSGVEDELAGGDAAALAAARDRLLVDLIASKRTEQLP